MSHTPGPWEARQLSVNKIEIGPEDLFVAEVDMAPIPLLSEDYANARLIAAAPELLEALKEVIAITDRKHDVWNRAHAAIDKAEGRS